MVNKQDALTYAIQLEIELKVREIAKGGKADLAGVNYTAVWEDNVIRATCGAGCNSTSVTKPDGTVLYASDDYGRRVKVYRHGRWAHRLVDFANAKIEAKKRDEANAKAEREQRDALNFASIDY